MLVYVDKFANVLRSSEKAACMFKFLRTVGKKSTFPCKSLYQKGIRFEIFFHNKYDSISNMGIL